MTTATSYDAVPYPTGAYAQTHPDRLAAIATLFGMAPAPVERCRVLEIGCGDGGNLIPMAYALPESAFTGIDLAGRPLAAGRERVARLGLPNIRLLQQDLAALPPDFGSFDYIIAHGIYAWVAPPVQDRLLAACRAHLAPQGVAFVSYNAYPGAHLREMIREMMQYHLRDVAAPADQLVAAKALLEFLHRSWPGRDDVRYWVGKQAELTLARQRDTLFHDELSEEYRPAYFHQFAARAARHGLQYLGESEYHEMDESGLPPQAVETLRKLGPDQLLQKEQYMDFLKCRSFRQTLLCGSEVALRRGIPTGLLKRFFVETRVEPAAGDPESTDKVEYRTAKGGLMTTSDPVVKRLMARLDQAAPRGVAFAELPPGNLSPAEVAALVIQMYSSTVIDLRLRPLFCVSDPGERPEASRVARLQLEGGEVVTSLRHLDVRFEDPKFLSLIRLLDGTRDRAALRRHLESAGLPTSADALDRLLRHLGRRGLLVS
ncbi:MAG: methyltransferase regulatory domain-containing protein [Planctomycetes bacterium]|nr:methyltransferase regulatory domain-containing protein [Planctomycetota bacterium]